MQIIGRAVYTKGESFVVCTFVEEVENRTSTICFFHNTPRDTVAEIAEALGAPVQGWRCDIINPEEYH